MTQQEILEYNRRCALFCTTEPEVLEQDLKKAGTLESMQYHSDWTWIMEVVEAIEDMDIVVLIGKNTCVIEQTYGKTSMELGSIKRGSKKEAVVEAINQFLNWYIMCLSHIDHK